MSYQGFGGKYTAISTGKKWSKTHLWRSMKAVVGNEKREVEYLKLLDTVFEGDEEPLHALVKDNILGLSVQQVDGREVKFVSAHSPLLHAAFKELTTDDTLRKRMEKLVVDEKAEKVKKDIRDIEEELQRLAKSKVGKSAAISARESHLFGKLDVRCLPVSRQPTTVLRHSSYRG